MIRSKFFWTGAILLAIIPLLALDIPKHYIDWKHDVRDQLMYLNQHTYTYSASQKVEILGQVSTSDHSLKWLITVKSLASLILFFAGCYYLYRYFKTPQTIKWKAAVVVIMLLALTSAAKLFSWTTFSGNNDIKLLQLSPADISLQNICSKYFKGKVVYVDFWGTTCPPCLEEFRNFTKPLKQHYQNRQDIAWLYICGGTRLIWKQQLQKFDVEGNNVFLDRKAYADLYHSAVRDSKDTIVSMPRYLVIDKKGNIVDKDAPGPGETDSVVTVLDKYLE